MTGLEFGGMLVVVTMVFSSGVYVGRDRLHGKVSNLETVMSMQYAEIIRRLGELEKKMK